MKFCQLYQLLFFCFLGFSISAQTDTLPKGAFIQGNNIRAGISSNGSLFWTPEEGKVQFFHRDYPGISNVS